MFGKPHEGSKVGCEITNLVSNQIDGLNIPLPAKIIGESDYSYLVEHNLGGELEDYEHFRFGPEVNVDKTYWAIDKDEVLGISDTETKMDKVKEILEKHATCVDEESSRKVWETRKFRKIRRALERAGLVRYWQVHNSGTSEVYIDADLFEIKNSLIHTVRLRLPQEEEEEERDKKPNQFKVDEHGTKRWYNTEGQLHRTDGPAIEYADGDKSWYVEGKLHRIDGPAIEHVNGTKHWYVEDKLHRTDGPAFVYADGHKEWYKEGKLHRTDGPAIEYADGSKCWYVEDIEYSEEEFKKKMANNSKEERKMNNESFKDQVKSDLEQVAYRQGARKITSVSHAVILHAFRQQGFSESKLNVLLEALESAPGKALLSYGLGKGLERVMTDSEVAQSLAEEFRISGMDQGVEAGLDKLAAKGLELAPAAMGLISAIEKTTKEGLTLETLQEFSAVDSKLPQEYQEELAALDKRVRISDSDPTPEEALTSELENQADAEAQAESESESESETELDSVTYASCS